MLYLVFSVRLSLALFCNYLKFSDDGIHFSLISYMALLITYCEENKILVNIRHEKVEFQF